MENPLKKIILLFTFLFFVFCERRPNTNELSNNSYNLIINSNDTIKLDLYDSTYCFFDDDYFNGINRWKLETTNNSSYLKLENSFVIKLDENFLTNNKGIIIGYKNIPVELNLRKSKCKNDFLNGNWIKKSDLKILKMIDEGNFKLPPPPPPPPNSTQEIVYPPVLKIKNDTLYLYEWYYKEKSKILMNLANDFLFVDLNIPTKQYRIKKINIRTVIKDTLYVQIDYYNYIDIKTENDTLVKIKR